MKNTHNIKINNTKAFCKTTDRRLETYDFTSLVIKWLILSLPKEEDKPIPLQPLLDLCNTLSRRLKTRGIKDTISYVKATRGNFFNYLSGNILRDATSKCYGPSQFPKILGPLKQFIDNEHYNVIRLVLTILTATRSIKLKDVVKTSTITQPIEGDVPDLTRHMPSFWKDLGYRLKPDSLPSSLTSVDWMMYRLSRGPNGHALLAAAYEATILPKSLCDSLDVIAPGIAYRIEQVISGKLDQFVTYWGRPSQKRTGLFRKLSSFPDKEGKQRTIGILDYWSQMALKPIHTYIGRALEKINQDCTLDQNKYNKLLKDVKGKFYSVDLTAATDRFPIQIIKELLKLRLGADFVNAWEDVMVGYPFDFQKDKLIYSTGSPMGAYTSFNSFAFTHHFLVYHCCKECNVSWKTLPYALLGDDIVIGNEEVAEVYMKVLKSIHVEFSPAKTHKSERFFEFAKRVHYKGIEVSPFPISALRQASKSSDTLVLVLREIRERGWEIISISSSVQKYFSIVKKFRSKVCKNIANNSSSFDQVLDLVRGSTTAYEVFNDILRRNRLRSMATFEEKHNPFLLKVLSLSWIKQLERSIETVYGEILGRKLSSLLKSNDLMKSYYAFVDKQSEVDSEMKFSHHKVINLPTYGAIYALEAQLKIERKMIEKFINSSSIVFNKKDLKPRMTKTIVSDLFVKEGDKKKIVNTIREFYNILVENAKILTTLPSYDPEFLSVIESKISHQKFRMETGVKIQVAATKVITNSVYDRRAKRDAAKAAAAKLEEEMKNNSS
jgi:hypothetical protein